MSHKSVRDCKDSGIELLDTCYSQGCIKVRQTDHVTIQTPSGIKFQVPAHRHNNPFTMKKIIKGLLAAGLTILSLGYLINLCKFA